MAASPAKSAEIALQAVVPAALCARVPGVSIEGARKIVAAVHRGEPVLERGAPPRGVSRVAFDAVRAASRVPTLEVTHEEASAVDPFVKYALGGHDGRSFETVRIPLEKNGRFSVCVSSQVGCALACAFCATGRLGLLRNLETWEIVEQVRIVRARLPAGSRVHGVVFQGMGEPMANLDRVLEAIAVMSDPCAQAIDARNVTVCTAGNPSGIARLAREAPKVRLAVSIGAARPEVRRRLMPIEQRFSLVEVLAAAGEHARATGLAPMWAVAPLAGVNDADEDAAALADLVRQFTAKYGARPRVSVIPYNAIDGGNDERGEPFRRQTDDEEARFRDALRARGVFTHKRYSGGGDVRAACGQLAGARASGGLPA